MIDLPPPGYAQTIEAIVQCDISRANIRIAYEDELQSDEITIADLGTLTDKKLQCLKAAVHPFYILTIRDNVQQAAFYEFSRNEERPKEQAKAREWVRSKGLLDRLPSFDPKQGISVFGVALEKACGLKAGSALMPFGQSSLTVRPDFIRNDKFKKLGDSLYCLTQMFAASNANEHDIRFAFIGNEAFRESDEG